MFSIRRLALDTGIKVIEDCAQAHGATYHGQKVLPGQNHHYRGRRWNGHHKL
jgi:hypothetical protein